MLDFPQDTGNGRGQAEGARPPRVTPERLIVVRDRLGLGLEFDQQRLDVQKKVGEGMTADREHFNPARINAEVLPAPVRGILLGGAFG